MGTPDRPGCRVLLVATQASAQALSPGGPGFTSPLVPGQLFVGPGAQFEVYNLPKLESRWRTAILDPFDLWRPSWEPDPTVVGPGLPCRRCSNLDFGSVRGAGRDWRMRSSVCRALSSFVELIQKVFEFVYSRQRKHDPVGLSADLLARFAIVSDHSVQVEFQDISTDHESCRAVGEGIINGTMGRDHTEARVLRRFCSRSVLMFVIGGDLFVRVMLGHVHSPCAVAVRRRSTRPCHLQPSSSS